MYIDKNLAIDLVSKAQRVISKLQEWTPNEPGMEDEKEEIQIVIVDLEYSIEKLQEAIENSPTK